MSYLGYQLIDGKITAVPSDVIDDHSRFKQTGNVFALKGIAVGFNVQVYGAPTPGGLVNFQKTPMFTAGWDATTPGDTGRLVPQAGGDVAIEWPL